MRGLLFFVVVGVLMGGCFSDAPPAKSSPASKTDFSTTPTGNQTVDALLKSLPHLRIAGPAILQIAMPNGTTTSPQVVSFLLNIYIDLDSSAHDYEGSGSPHLIAFVPIKFHDSVTTCAPTVPKDLHHMFRGRDVSSGGGGGGNSGQYGNLTGKYVAGWYHVIAVGTESATFRMELGADVPAETKPRTLPSAPDPFVGGGGARLSGSNTLTQTVTAPIDASWISWGSIRVSGGLPDGGRTTTMNIASDCAKASRTTQAAGGGFGQGSGALSALAVGKQTTFDVVGKYTPQVTPPAMPPTTNVDVGWVWMKAVTAENAPVPTNATSPSPSPTA